MRSAARSIIIAWCAAPRSRIPRSLRCHSVHTQEQIKTRDDQGSKHAVTVTRVPMPGSPHLQGLPYFTWGAGRYLKLVDDKAGILEYVRTGQRLKIEDWG